MKNIDWKSLSFGYVKTDYNVRCYFRDGKWGELEVMSDEYIPMHMAASCLHYGQEAFEGMKAFRGKDGKVRLFRWEENWKRLNSSADTIMLAPIPKELFFAALEKVIKLNAEYIPPYGTEGSLYIRPLLIGTGATIGVKPADEYLFVVFVMPVGPYFKEGFKPTNMQIAKDYDRAAPLGTGHVKVGGNYAASLRAGERAHHEGFSASIFADAKTKTYIDEAGPANFFGIKDGKYVTPDSGSILPSITNMSLRQIAEDLGLVVERRHVALDEIGTFEEAGACGTAAVISPIHMIQDRETGKEYVIAKDGKPGPWSIKMREILMGIQYGEIEDKYNWCTIVEC
ncbi:MAG: branched-chain amino acid aminotransferase [Bacteroidales bacterium]|jgi:branched-chain amino acid aminotransferase|nr:branched-chain amino acid aminotransferase [Bacteroidales bacterium]MBR3571967.1 branched-chain amino acid aminotransferase [Bacteroidales bacterium]